MTMTDNISTFVMGLCLIVLFLVSLNCNAGGDAQNKSALVIQPNVVTPNDVISISFPRKRPKKMSVRSPNNEWYVVHEKSENFYLLPKNGSSTVTSVQKKFRQ